MAYTFLLNDDNYLTASHKEVIMQRSKLVDDIHFLVNPTYKLNDMSIFSVVLEYILPVSKKYHTVELTKDADGYKEYLKYVVPLDTNLSSEAGDIELQLSFIFTGLGAAGHCIQKVRKTMPAKLHITPIAAWSDIIPDDALSALDQRIIKIDAQMKQLNNVSSVLSETKADNLKYNNVDNSLQLMSGSKTIGDRVVLKECAVNENGIPVIDFDSGQGGGTKPDTGSDIVEF